MSNVATAEFAFLPYAITQTPFLYHPPGFALHQVMETLLLPNMARAIPVWYVVTVEKSRALGLSDFSCNDNCL